jgi:hypothetical protein
LLTLKGTFILIYIQFQIFDREYQEIFVNHVS